MRTLLCGIALAALAAPSIQADPGGGKGHGGGKEAAGGQHERGGKGDERGPGPLQIGVPGRGNGNGNGSHDHAPPGQAHKARGDAERDKDRPDLRPVAGERGQFREDRGRDDIERTNQSVRVNARRPDWRSFDQRGLISGCPPGLAKKNNGCMPPGLAKKAPDFDHPATWWGLRGLPDLTGYRYYNGDLVRLSPAGDIAGYYPLLGGSLAIGNPWPSMWQPTLLNPYYANYFGLGDNYRYFDGAIYEIDPATSAIRTIAALLTGDDFSVGQRLPVGYDAYNVPYQYRDRYIDGPDALYRYSDGYVYKVDPRTRLITAAIELLT